MSHRGGLALLNVCAIGVLMLGLTVASVSAVELPQPRRVEIGITDGLKLVSDYYPSMHGAAPGLLLLHGWDWPGRSPAAGLRDHAREFQRAGYAVLAPNMRGWPPPAGVMIVAVARWRCSPPLEGHGSGPLLRSPR